VDSQEGAAAYAIWNHLLTLKPTVNWKKAYAFLELLVSQNRFDEAGTVWKQALAADGAAGPAAPAGSLVHDGGFESELSNGGFGWRQQNVAGADFDFDTEVKHSGMRAARVMFDRTQNLSYGNLYQWVLVQPNTRYRFRGFLRADHISTDSGVRFEIVDPRRQGDLDVLTVNETGTIPWTMEETEFKTGPQTHLIGVVLRRAASNRFDNKISGTVWLDDVSVVPAGASK
jgi:hypothetical protein